MNRFTGILWFASEDYAILSGAVSELPRCRAPSATYRYSWRPPAWALSMKLSESQKRHLRTLGHHLKPVVWVGQHGLKEGVIAEIEQALGTHELIKVKVVADRDTRADIASDICAQTRAAQIHSIGQMVILFRRNEEKPKIALPSG